MRNISTWFFSFSLSFGFGLLALASMPTPAVAIYSQCVEGCINQLAGDLDGCKYWFEPNHIDETAYADCVGAAASHATQCLGGCGGGGSSRIIGHPGGSYGTYAPGQQLVVAAGLKDNGSYVHDVGPILQTEAFLLSYDEYATDTTLTIRARNWVSVGPMTFDGDSLWKAQVDMAAFPSMSGYLVRYDFTGGPSDTTLMSLTSLIPQATFTAVLGGSNPALLQLSFTPNPTRDRSHINFYLPISGQAEVALYDLAGRRLRSWKWNSLSAGQHTVAWDWTLESGQRLSSSVVFCRLTVDGQAVSHPMTRLR
jgi:hypothetical protein